MEQPGSIGISLFTTIFTMRSSFHLAHLKEQTNLLDPLFQQSYQSLIHGLTSSGIPAEQGQMIASTILSGKAFQLAAVSGINDAFFWATCFTVLGVFLSFFLRDVRKDRLPENNLEKSAQESSQMDEKPSGSLRQKPAPITS